MPRGDRRAVRRRDHVVIAGMGQVGLRLALLLRDSGVPVVGIERDPHAVGVRHGRRFGLFVVIAEAGDCEGAEPPRDAWRSRAAVTSGHVTSLAIAPAALAVHPAMRIALRAGEGDIATRAVRACTLATCTAGTRSSATDIAARALSSEPSAVITEADGDARCVPGEAAASRRAPSPARSAGGPRP